MFGGLKKAFKKVGGVALGGLGLLGGMMSNKGGGGGEAAPAYKQVLPELQKHTSADQSVYDKLNTARARFGGSAIRNPSTPAVQGPIGKPQGSEAGLGALGRGFSAMARSRGAVRRGRGGIR